MSRSIKGMEIPREIQQNEAIKTKVQAVGERFGYRELSYRLISIKTLYGLSTADLARSIGVSKRRCVKMLCGDGDATIGELGGWCAVWGLRICTTIEDANIRIEEEEQDEEEGK